LQYLQRSLENTVGRLAIAKTGFDFFVGLIRYTNGVIPVLCCSELLSKFGETSFIRSLSLPDPLFAFERFGPKNR
jgi:hypothetical protein